VAEESTDSAASIWLSEVAEEETESSASTFWSSLVLDEATDVSSESTDTSTFWLSEVAEEETESSSASFFWLLLVLEETADVPLESTEFSTFWLSLVLEVSTEDSASLFLASEVAAEVTEVSTSSTPSGVVAELTELDLAPSFLEAALFWDLAESLAATRAEVAEDWADLADDFLSSLAATWRAEVLLETFDFFSFLASG